MIVSIDCEHSYGIMYPWEEGFYLTNVGIVTSKGDEDVIWFTHSTELPTLDAIKLLQSYIDRAHTVIGHNLKHDINILRSLGVTIPASKLWCTMTAEYLLSGQAVGTRRFALDEVAAYRGLELKEDRVRDYWNDGVDTKDIPSDVLHSYVLQDCRIPLALYEIQHAEMYAEKMEKLILLQMQWVSILSEMESNGFIFDISRARDIIEEYERRTQDVQRQISELTELEYINPGSSQQVSALLFGGLLKMQKKEWVIVELKSKPESLYRERTIDVIVEYPGLGFKAQEKKKGKNGYYSVTKKTIEALPARTNRQREIKKLLIEYSQCAMVGKTLQGKTGEKGLLNKVQKDGRIHPKFNIAVTKTGRLTSSDPNGQNMPRGSTSPIKECIIPEFDGIFELDLSQIEWRVAGELAGDEVIIHEVNSGIDQHSATTVELMEMELNKENRTHAKVFNFRMIYGGGKWGFYLDIDMPRFSLARWAEIIANFFNKYFGLAKWHADNIRIVFQNGELRAKTGRKWVFNKEQGKDGAYTYQVNQIKNYPVQGVAGGDAMPLCAVVLDRGIKKYNLKSKWLLTVHDSLVIDYKKEELPTLLRLGGGIANSLHHYMSNYFQIEWKTNLAGEIKTGPNYGSMKEVEL